MNQNRYLIIADDFTGANDTGVQLKRRGFSTDVIFDPALIGPEGSFVLDTESRRMSGPGGFQCRLPALRRNRLGFLLHCYQKD